MKLKKPTDLFNKNLPSLNIFEIGQNLYIIHLSKDEKNDEGIDYLFHKIGKVQENTLTKQENQYLLKYLANRDNPCEEILYNNHSDNSLKQIYREAVDTAQFILWDYIHQTDFSVSALKEKVKLWGEKYEPLISFFNMWEDKNNKEI